MNNPDNRISIYVVEDDNAVLKSLCALLTAHGHITIPCPSAEHFLRIYDPSRKSFMILDLRLPGMSGIQLQDHMNKSGITIPVIVITAHGDVPIAVKAMQSGAIDFIEKPTQEEPILNAVKTATSMIFDRSTDLVSKKVVADRLASLTERERTVLNHLLQGKLNKEIADELSVSLRTIEGHRSRIREKMHARGIADLIRMVG